MGEAKRRGSEAERKEQAIRDGNANIFEMIKTGQAPHYAFVFDRSALASNVLKQMKAGPAELQARIASQAVQFWEASHFQFVVIWGTWGMTGGLTIPCLDLENLINQGIPAAMERTEEKGGLCSFMPFVAPELAEVVQNKIAELQPTSGPQGTPQ